MALRRISDLQNLKSTYNEYDATIEDKLWNCLIEVSYNPNRTNAYQSFYLSVPDMVSGIIDQVYSYLVATSDTMLSTKFVTLAGTQTITGQKTFNNSSGTIFNRIVFKQGSTTTNLCATTENRNSIGSAIANQYVVPTTYAVKNFFDTDIKNWVTNYVTNIIEDSADGFADTDLYRQLTANIAFLSGCIDYLSGQIDSLRLLITDDSAEEDEPELTESPAVYPDYSAPFQLQIEHKTASNNAYALLTVPIDSYLVSKSSESTGVAYKPAFENKDVTYDQFVNTGAFLPGGSSIALKRNTADNAKTNFVLFPAHNGWVDPNNNSAYKLAQIESDGKPTSILQFLQNCKANTNCFDSLSVYYRTTAGKTTYPKLGATDSKMTDADWTGPINVLTTNISDVTCYQVIIAFNLAKTSGYEFVANAKWRGHSWTNSVTKKTFTYTYNVNQRTPRRYSFRIGYSTTAKRLSQFRTMIQWQTATFNVKDATANADGTIVPV